MNTQDLPLNVAYEVKSITMNLRVSLICEHSPHATAFVNTMDHLMSEAKWFEDGNHDGIKNSPDGLMVKEEMMNILMDVAVGARSRGLAIEIETLKTNPKP